MNFLWLIFAHYVGDTGLQNDYTIANKKKCKYIMFSHCMVWALCVCVALNYLDILVWWKPIFLAAGHYLIDNYKVKFPERYRDFIDQILHLGQLIIIYFL